MNDQNANQLEKMKKLLLTLSLCSVIGSLFAQTTYSKEVEEQIKQVENNLSSRLILNDKPDNILDRMAHYNVKGVSIAVIENYKVIWAKGYGWADENEKRPVTPSTLFMPGSISKSINAMGILKLVQDKKLDLFTDINTYLTSWKFPYDSISNGKKITLSHLLSHSAGLSFHGSDGYSRTAKIPTLQQILDGEPPSSSLKIRSDFEPGLYHQYSNGGIVITQLMLTDVTKQPYEKFMYNTVLKPLGMTNSFFNQPPPKNKVKLLATGYNEDGTELATKYNIIPEQAAGGLWTTPSDVSKFVIETQLALEGKSSKILSTDMTKLQLTPTVDPVSALGVFIDKRGDTKYFTHDARNYGYSGVYYGSMEGGNGVVIFTNSYNVGLLPELANSVASVYKWKEFHNPKQINTVSVPDATTQKYLGVYLYDGKIAEVTKESDGMYFWTANQNSKMYFTSEIDFENIEFTAEKTFIVDSLGNAIGYKRKVNGTEFSPALKVLQIDSLKADSEQMISYGWHLLETKRLDKAIFFLEKELKLQPENNTVRGYLAHCYLFHNEYDKAIKLYTNYLNNKNENSSDLKEWLKWELDYFKKKDFDKALIDKAIFDLKLDN